MVKLNFHNAFNSIRRDKMFEATTPDNYPIVHSSSYFFIFFILAADGVQQGDPLGPFLFSITILQPTMFLMSVSTFLPTHTCFPRPNISVSFCLNVVYLFSSCGIVIRSSSHCAASSMVSLSIARRCGSI